MRKTLRYKKKITRKTKNMRKYRGGTYYSYNKNPLRFTSSTLQKGGAPFSLNVSDTLIPQGVINAGRTAIYNASSNPFMGYYPAVNPDPSVQPISKSYMLGK
jgi:hypothetical protein